MLPLKQFLSADSQSNAFSVAGFQPCMFTSVAIAFKRNIGYYGQNQTSAKMKGVDPQ